MNKISGAFAGKKAFIAYIMAGDPNLSVSAQYILAAQEAGADMIEIGIPFSDPVAEGEVVEAAHMRSLHAGTRLDGIFEMLASIKDQMRTPMAFATYLNPVFVYGYDSFFARCVDVGVCAVIIPDMPFEEQGEAKEAAGRHGVEIITLIAPTSGERISKIARQAQGFIYLIPPMDTDGDGSAALTAMVAEIKKAADIPVAIDCGTCSPQQARRLLASADSIIVGSSIASIVQQHGENARQPLYEHIKELKKDMMQP